MITMNNLERICKNRLTYYNYYLINGWQSLGQNQQKYLLWAIVVASSKSKKKSTDRRHFVKNVDFSG